MIKIHKQEERKEGSRIQRKNQQQKYIKTHLQIRHRRDRFHQIPPLELQI